MMRILLGSLLSLLLAGPAHAAFTGATINTQAGVTYTLSNNDCSNLSGSTLNFTSGSAVTVKVPNGLKPACFFDIVQQGAGLVTFSTAGDNPAVTLQSVDNCTGSAGQFAAFGVFMVTATTAQIYGRCK